MKKPSYIRSAARNWVTKEILSWGEAADEQTRLGNLYPSISRISWFEENINTYTYRLRIIFNNEADEAEFIVKESVL
jgi:hypothetical protein